MTFTQRRILLVLKKRGNIENLNALQRGNIRNRNPSVIIVVIVVVIVVIIVVIIITI